MAQPLLDTPEGRRRTVRLLLVLSPFGFVLAYLLAAVQGAEPSFAFLLGAVMFVGCLAVAGLVHLAGSNARYAFVAIALLRLFMRR